MNQDHTAANVSALLAQGREKQLQGELPQAELLYEQALSLSPLNADVLYLLGTLAVMAQDDARALQLLDSASLQNPNHVLCACLRGHVLHKSGRLDDALQSLEHAAALMPGHPIAWKYRMEVLLDLARPEEVVRASDQRLAGSPADLQAHFFRGNALVMMRRHADALQSYGQALAIDPSHVESNYNLIQTWVRIDEDDPHGGALAQALDAARQFLALKPQEPKAHWLCAAVLKEQGDVDAAEPHYQEILRLDPTHPTAPYGLATCWLSQGQWTQGWEMFEHRARIRPAEPDARILQGKPWNGEPLAGKSILLFSEGGFGDTLNFARYIPAVGGMAAQVGVLVQPELRDLLMATGTGTGSTDLASSYDYHCGLMSLPRLFGTRPDNVPLADGYVRADEARTRHWRDRLQNSGRLRVGLAWSGNPKFLNDHNRSIPLSVMAGLLDVAGVDYFCLQQVVRDTERETLASLPQLVFLGDELRDFSDTAALCNAMDLVISVDTSVAHLAGALGKPVWIMLPFAAEYRWMMRREDTPWYTQARLFRQRTRANWSDVVARVREELQLLRTASDAAATVTPSNLIAQGMALQKAADTDGAAACYARAAELAPSNVQAHFLCALVAVQQDRLLEARGHLETACALDPAHGQAAMLRGHVLDRLAEHPEALTSLETAAELMPQSPMVWNYRAQTLYSLRRYDEALASCDHALSLAPERSDALFLRGVLLQMLGRSNEAMQALNPLFMKQPDDPDLHELMAQICLAGVGHGQPESELFQHAQKYLDTVIALEPCRATAHETRGSILERSGDPQAALESYRRALAIKPDWDNAAYAVGRCLLALGDWENGWAAYERRWFRRNAMAWRRQTAAPLWRGESLAGKSIAIVAERGFGDVIQFYRFVEPIRALASSVSLVLPPPLHRLLGPAVDLGQSPPARFDYHCPLLSLAHRLGIDASNMPGTEGYLLADPALTAAWRQRLGPTPRLRAGVVWQGDPTHGNDHNRSMSLAQLATLLDVEGVEFVCLQQVMRDADRQVHATLPQLRFYGDELHDFADTAALCDAMDLVISVDTSVAHLAGALNKPLWVLLPAVAEWRWMQDREDSPWYARARLFRQSQQGDWDGVIRRVRDGLIDAAAAAR